MNTHPTATENPWDQRVSLPLVAARLCAAAIVIGALTSGSRVLEWISVPLLLWVLIVIWGRHVLFTDNLAHLPNLGPAVAHDAIPDPLPGVSLIAPARNEAAGIEAAARATAAIDYPALDILIVDDHSTDDTLRILEAVAREHPHLRVLAAPDPPAGWSGKINASKFGFQQSRADSPWLLFTDARVIFHPNAITSVIAHAEANHLDFLSCVIRFEAEGLAEELVAIIQNRGLVLSALAFGGKPPLFAYGLGAFTLIRREAYLACGGHARFPGHALEDFMLAKSVRLSGAVTGAAVASEIVAIRRYHGFADLRPRIVRSLRTGSSDSLLDLLNRISMDLLFNLLPFAAAAGGVLRMGLTRAVPPALCAIFVLAGLAYLAGTCTPRNCRGICRFRPWVAWLHPLGAALWIMLLLRAMVDRVRGRAVSWRGRKVFAPR